MKKYGMAALAAALAICATAAPADDKYPTHPIRVIIPFSAGSATDIVPRMVFEKMSLGQTIVVENRGGAGGTIGVSAVASASPDGYTLLAHSAAHTVAPSLYSKLSYDPAADFHGVLSFGNAPTVAVVAPSKNIKTLKELEALAKTKPEGLTFASAGIGTGTHLAAERWIQSAGIKALHIPFKGGPEALTEVLTGRVDFMFGALPSAQPHIKDGRLVALAVSPQKRISALPDVPTTEEVGYKDSHYDVWLGLLAPAKTPPDIIAKLYAEGSRAMADPEVQAKLKKVGMEALAMTPAEFDARIREEIKANEKIIRNAGIKQN